MIERKKILVLGLGNDILADDAVGILAVRELREKHGELADFVDTPEHGIVLLDYFMGYEKAIVVDAMLTGEHAPGTIVEINPAELRYTPAPSPHFTGLPELFSIAKQLGIEFPQEVKIIAIEIENPLTLGGEMSESVKGAFDEFVSLAGKVLKVMAGVEE